jgi:ABC-type lipoprotein release transport system permease subunit
VKKKIVNGVLLVIGLILFVSEICQWILRIPSGQPITADSFISIMVTLLGVMVAVLTIFIAVAAIMGYSGLKEHVKQMVDSKAQESVEQTMKQYPKSGDILNALKELKMHSEALKSMQDQIATVQDSSVLANGTNATASESCASNGIKELEPRAGGSEETSFIAPYPGEDPAVPPFKRNHDKEEKDNGNPNRE